MGDTHNEASVIFYRLLSKVLTCSNFSKFATKSILHFITHSCFTFFLINRESCFKSSFVINFFTKITIFIIVVLDLQKAKDKYRKKQKFNKKKPTFVFFQNLRINKN